MLINKEYYSVADGSWTEWTTWGECSKSCGSGVQVRTRDCSNPPPSGNGKNCAGEASEERDCNTKECSSRYITIWMLQKPNKMDDIFLIVSKHKTL